MVKEADKQEALRYIGHKFSMGLNIVWTPIDLSDSGHYTIQLNDTNYCEIIDWRRLLTEYADITYGRETLWELQKKWEAEWELDRINCERWKRLASSGIVDVGNMIWTIDNDLTNEEIVSIIEDENKRVLAQQEQVKKCNGLMGVPITALDKLNMEKFEIVDYLSPIVDGKNKYGRYIIRRRF